MLFPFSNHYGYGNIRVAREFIFISKNLKIIDGTSLRATDRLYKFR
jgi:hypothetical protein